MTSLVCSHWTAAREVKKAVKDLRSRDSGRFDATREAFANEEDGE